MAAQEKQDILFRLETVIPIFQKFDEAYNMVVSLPMKKRDTIDPNSIPNTQIKKKVPKSLGGLFRSPADLVDFVTAPPSLSDMVRSTSLGRKLNDVLQFDPEGAEIDRIQDQLDAMPYQIEQLNQQTIVNNAEIDRQVAIAQGMCDEIRRRYSLLDMSWYPPDYQFYDAAVCFHKALRNGICETLGEAVRYYEEQSYRNQVLANQHEQIKYAFQQCILQGQTIDAINRQGEAIQQTMREEGAAIRQTIREEGSATRDAMYRTGSAIQGTIQSEGAASRKQSARQYKDFLRRFDR